MFYNSTDARTKLNKEFMEINKKPRIYSQKGTFSTEGYISIINRGDSVSGMHGISVKILNVPIPTDPCQTELYGHLM